MHTIYVIFIHICQHHTHIRNNDIAIKKAFFTFLHFFFASFCRYRLLRIASYTTLVHSLGAWVQLLILIIDVSKCEFYSISLNCLAGKPMQEQQQQPKPAHWQHCCHSIRFRLIRMVWMIHNRIYARFSTQFLLLLTPLLCWMLLCQSISPSLFLLFSFVPSVFLPSSIRFANLSILWAWPVRFFFSLASF